MDNKETLTNNPDSNLSFQEILEEELAKQGRTNNKESKTIKDFPRVEQEFLKIKTNFKKLEKLLRFGKIRIFITYTASEFQYLIDSDYELEYEVSDLGVEFPPSTWVSIEKSKKLQLEFEKAYNDLVEEQPREFIQFILGNLSTWINNATKGYRVKHLIFHLVLPSKFLSECYQLLDKYPMFTWNTTTDNPNMVIIETNEQYQPNSKE